MNHFHNIDWHVTDRCNLKCSSCGHFASLVSNIKGNTDRTLEQAQQDFEILYNKTNNGEYVDQLCLTGGEPTLNPLLPEIIDIAEKYFTGKIIIWSNCINLNLYTGKLINKIKQYNISINVTCYDFNREQTIRDFFNTYGIHATLYFKNFSGNFNNGCEFFNKFFTQNVIEDTGDCTSKYWCTQLKDQKLYVCQYLGYMNHFINKFGIEEAHKIGYDENFAYLDLTKVNDYSEIEQYMNNYDENICKHCIDRWNCNDIKRRLKNWSTTKENISEWVIDDINNLKCELS